MVFINCMIFDKLCNVLLTQTVIQVLPGMVIKLMVHDLIYDLVYSLLLYCLNKNESGKSNTKVVFNIILSSTNNQIEYLWIPLNTKKIPPQMKIMITFEKNWSMFSSTEY